MKIERTEKISEVLHKAGVPGADRLATLVESSIQEAEEDDICGLCGGSGADKYVCEDCQHAMTEHDRLGCQRLGCKCRLQSDRLRSYADIRRITPTGCAHEGDETETCPHGITFDEECEECCDRAEHPCLP